MVREGHQIERPARYAERTAGRRPSGRVATHCANVGVAASCCLACGGGGGDGGVIIAQRRVITP